MSNEYKLSYTAAQINSKLGEIDYLVKDAELGSLAKKDIVSKTDVSSDIQTSLNKADTALQSFTETDPTVPAWAKEPTKPTYTANEVGARPNTWMPTAADVGATSINEFYNASNILAPDFTGYATLFDYIRAKYIEGKHFVVGYIIRFTDMPETDWGYSMVAQRSEGDAWDVQIRRMWNNAIYVRQLNTNSGWMQDKWTQLATTDYALPRDGSAPMTGGLNIALASNGWASILKNHNATLDYGTDFGDYDSSTAHANINVSAKNNKVTWYGTDRVGHDILHTGNMGAFGIPKIEAGSYVGTGKTGSSNPTKITFSFEPKMVIISRVEGLNPAEGYWQHSGIWHKGNTMFKVQSKFVNVTATTNAISFYTTDSNAYTQLNGTGATYYYFAIG